MPIFRPGTRNQGTSGASGPSAAEQEKRRNARRERRADSQRVTTSTPPIPGRVTNPPGAIVPNTAADGILGGQFGNSPGMPDITGLPAASYLFQNAPSVYPPTRPPVAPLVTSVNDDITAIGGRKYSNRPGTGGMPGFQQPSLIGAPGSGSDNYYANSDNWTTIQSAEEAQSKYKTDTTAGAYVSNSVQGNKWKVKIVQLENGQWVKLTVPDYGRGARRRRNTAGKVQQQETYQTPQEYQRSIYNQVMSWRLATG